MVDMVGGQGNNFAIQGGKNCCVHEWHSPISANKKTPLVGVFLLVRVGSRLKSLQAARKIGRRYASGGLPRAERGGSISLHLRNERT